MITSADFHRIVTLLGGQAQADITWAENTAPPDSAEEFALEAIYVICNSGMKNTVALGVYRRCVAALEERRPVREVFGHPGKAAAIETIWRDRDALFLAYCKSTERLTFLESLPWIGNITKYHLAKNFGVDVAKPDVHLQRLADREGCTVQALCERLATSVGLRVASVDTVLWRACATGVLNSRTGEIASAATEALL
jgi:hypothetical protein